VYQTSVYAEAWYIIDLRKWILISLLNDTEHPDPVLKNTSKAQSRFNNEAALCFFHAAYLL